MRIRPRWIVPLIAVAALALAAAALPLFSGNAADGVPIYRVVRQDFERRVVAEGQLSAVRATPLSADPTIRSSLRIAWMVPDGSRVSAGDPVMRFDPTDIEKRLENANDDLATSRLKIDKEKIESGGEVENLRRDKELAGVELDMSREFQKKDAEIFSRQEIIEAEIDETLATHREEHAEKALETRQDLSGTQLQILEIERRRAHEKIDEAEGQLASLEITAPHDGLVVFQRDWRGNLPRVGDQIYPGNPVAEIPDLAQMQAEVFVLEADAAGLEVGKSAEVRLENYPGRVYPAVIERVDSLAKPQLRRSPVQYFAVVLELDHTDVERMKPGQRVRATLLLDHAENALVVPRQAVFEREGKKIVFRRGHQGFEPVPVTLGAVGLGRVAVESGLSEGDVIALADPGGSFGGAPEDTDKPEVSPGPGGLGAP